MHPDEHQIAWIAVASTLSGGILVALVTGFFTLRSRRNDYVNDFYKTVIEKRIHAYEQLEILIIAFKTSLFDQNDGKLYHQPFADKTQTQSLFVQHGACMSQGLWLSDEAFGKVRHLNRLLFPMFSTAGEVITFGKEHYQEIANLREALEVILAADMLEMHKVKKFLSAKKKRKSGFEPFDPQGRSTR